MCIQYALNIRDSILMLKILSYHCLESDSLSRYPWYPLLHKYSIHVYGYICWTIKPLHRCKSDTNFNVIWNSCWDVRKALTPCLLIFFIESNRNDYTFILNNHVGHREMFVPYILNRLLQFNTFKVLQVRPLA